MDRPKQLWIGLGALAAAGAVAVAGRVGREVLRRNQVGAGPRPADPERPSDGGPPRGGAPERPGRERTQESASKRRRSRAYRLGRWEPAGEGLRRVVLGRLDHAADELSGRAGDARPEAVHEARKDLKKVRAVVRLLRDRLGDELYRRENAHFRDTGRALAGARDAQVRLDTLDRLIDHGTVPAEAVADFRVQLEKERASAATPGDDESGEGASERIAAARERASNWPVGEDGWDAVGPGLRRSYSRGRARMRDVLESPGVESLHEWRKRAKDLWYHLRLVSPAWPAVIGALSDEAHTLSERLGDDHDLAMLGESARTASGTFSDPDDLDLLLDAIQRVRADLQSSAISIGRRLYADKPAAFAGRMQAWWEAWRDPRAISSAD